MYEEEAPSKLQVVPKQSPLRLFLTARDWCTGIGKDSAANIEKRQERFLR